MTPSPSVEARIKLEQFLSSRAASWAAAEFLKSNVDCCWDTDASNLGVRGANGAQAAEQGLPLLVVNHCLKPAPPPRRMSLHFFSQQRAELATSRCFGRDILQQRAEPFFNVEPPVALESGDAVVAWHPLHR